MKKRAMAALAAATMLTSCGSAADPAQVVDTIRTTEQAQLDAIKSKDLVGIARLYADDAALVRPDGTVLQGGGAIADAYADLLDDPNFAITITPREGWASTADDLAVVTSDVDFTTSNADGKPQTNQMISQTVWTRSSGGTWKIVSAHNAPVAEGDVVAE